MEDDTQGSDIELIEEGVRGSREAGVAAARAASRRVRASARAVRLRPLTDLLVVEEGEADSGRSSRSDPDWQEPGPPPRHVPCGKAKRPAAKRPAARRAPPRNLLEEALAERLTMELEAESIDIGPDLPPAKRPRAAARPHVLRVIAGLLAEDDQPEGGPTDGNRGEPEAGPTDPDGPECDVGPAGTEGAAASRDTVQTDPGLTEPEVGSAAADGRTAEPVDPDKVLFEEAGDAEGGMAASLILPQANKRIPIIYRVKQLLYKRKCVHEIHAQYRELLPAADEGDGTEPAAGQPAGWTGSGRPLLVLRPESAPAADLTARLEEQRVSARDGLLPPASMLEALDVIHALRLQNLSLQADLLRMGTEQLRREAADPSEPPPAEKGRPGRKKVLATVAADRLVRLEQIESGVERIFTPSQIRNFCRNCKRNSAQWAEEDFRRAIELRAICSRKVFEHVRGEMGIPLPCVETLKLRCPRYPPLQAALQRALRAPAPRCPTCRRARDDAQSATGGPLLHATLTRKRKTAKTPPAATRQPAPSPICRAASVVKTEPGSASEAESEAESDKDSSSPDEDGDGDGCPAVMWPDMDGRASDRELMRKLARKSWS